MKHTMKQARELRFVCPKCGSNSLRVKAHGWLDIDHFDEDGVTTWGSMTPEDTGQYQCGNCGYALEFDSEADITSWLKEHCGQQEARLGQSAEDNSVLPPNDGEKHNELERSPRMRYVGFHCPKCHRGGWLIWHRRKESAMQAYVWEFTIVDGNKYPEITGFYQEEPECKDPDRDFETGTWTCSDCGHVLTDHQGIPLTSLEEALKYITIHYGEIAFDLVLDPSMSLEDILKIYFDKGSERKHELHSRRKDLCCPSCGNNEFIEEKEWLIQTPVRVESGMLHWCTEERLWEDMDRPEAGRYYCSKCGFVSPVPIEA